MWIVVVPARSKKRRWSPQRRRKPVRGGLSFLHVAFAVEQITVETVEDLERGVAADGT